MLGYLHKKGIVYRDLKSENLLVDKDGHIQFIDMGLAKNKMTSETLTYSFCGTAEYMAPEIASREGHTFPSDWYSFGALVYEMISG